MNLLILDDDALFRRRLTEEMARLGHDAVAFAAWPSALDFLDGDRAVDLIVTALDFRAGGPNGVSLARMSLRRRPGIRILFVSGSEEVARQVDPRLGPVVLKRDGVGRVVELIRAMKPPGGREFRWENRAVGGDGEPTLL